MKVLCFAVAVAGTCQAALAGVGPVGYWMTSGNSTTLARYDNGVTSTFATYGGQDYPIAVSGDVRTIGSGQFGGDFGGQYDLNGVQTGTQYPGFDPDNFDHLFYDGTTDGSNHFLMNYGNLGGVWMTDRTWGNMTKLFDLGGFGNRLGITYDGTNNSLWVSHWDNGVIENYSMGGALLTSWDSGLGGSLTCLAMDPSDHSLWMGRQTAAGFFYNYDVNGNRRGSFNDSTLGGMNTLGGEFNIVPEPATMVALGLGLAALARKRRTR